MGAYLGAWLHPVSATAGSAFAVEQQTTPTVTAVAGRQLGILHIYSNWSQPTPVTDLAAVSAAGSIPLLDWSCGDGVQQGLRNATHPVTHHGKDAHRSRGRGRGH